MRKLFLGIGECMVELSDAGNGLLRQAFAGDVFNTLYYANPRLPEGWKSGFFTALGEDPLSNQMVGFIDQSGIETSHIQRIPDRRPGLYMIHLNDGERSFSYWREHSAARLLANDEELLSKAVLDANLVFFSGITLGILTPKAQDFLLKCVNLALNNGVLVVFDPNFRPALWPDLKIMRETIQRAAESATIILPSFDDEKEAFGDRSADETLARYGGDAKRVVILKNGDGEIITKSERGIQVFPTHKVTPVDSTGAGDSFNGAFLAKYVETGDIEKSVHAGQDCASKVIAHHGALIPR